MPLGVDEAGAAVCGCVKWGFFSGSHQVPVAKRVWTLGFSV